MKRPGLPIPKHGYTRGDGSQVEYIEDSTKPCIRCNSDDLFPDRRMAVRMRIDDSVQLECVNCGSTETMRATDFDELFKL